MIEMFKNELTTEHSGAVAFEYIIILVIMAVAIFSAWRLLSAQLISKAGQISDFIKNNGQSALGS